MDFERGFDIGVGSAGPIYRSSEILKAERDRPIDDLTNNHLIRQRLTILLRLVNDMIDNYAEGDTQLVTNIVCEVARDLQEYSGLTAKEMAGELTKRLSHFTSAVKYLEKHAPDLQVNGSLIRKCRIAMDMNWQCPFTGKKYDPQSLGSLEREHIIPYTDRPTNALDALVLTFDWVNKLKGKRTGLEFIQDMAGDSRFFTPKQYESFVKKLKVSRKETYPDDYRRQSARKKWLMVENYEQKDHGFTQGSLTKTSHLNRLSARQIEKRFIDPVSGDCTVNITSIPGQITAETRKSWKLLHTLDQACPECAGKNKTEIRKLTHLHHALDATTIALTHHFLPGTLPRQRENEQGAIWAAMLKRNKTNQETLLLKKTGMFNSFPKTDKEGNPVLGTDGKPRYNTRLKDIPKELKAQLASKLTECRVVQHIPADQSGAALEMNQWRVWEIHGDPTSSETSVTLRQQTSVVKDGKRQITRKETTEKIGKLVGLEKGKLKKNKAVLVIAENYGFAIDPQPSIIPFHNIPSRLRMLYSKNGGKFIRILRNGMLVRISNWEGKNGIWRIYSCKANGKIDFGSVGGTERMWCNVLISSLLKKNALEILSPPLTGVNPEDSP